MRLRRVGGALGVMLALTLAGEARAYCRARGCDPNKEECAVENGCVAMGPELRWPDRCVTINVHGDGSPKNGIDYAAFASVVREAFLSWEDLDCGAGRGPSIHFEVIGPVSCNPERERINVIAFRDDVWPYAGGVDTLGQTLITFDTESGEIQEVDIEINGTEPISLTGSSGNDLTSVITHEAGHFLGLDHSTMQGATMEARYHAGLATLEADDVAGVCEIYPPVFLASQAVWTCKFPPDACAVDEPPSESPNPPPDPPLCSTSPGRSAPSSGTRALPWMLSALALLGTRRLRRARAR